MPSFKLRATLPRELSWEQVEGSDLADAVNNYHLGLARCFSVELPQFKNCPPGWVQFLARIEIEGDGTVVSRILESRLVRKGGVLRLGESFEEKLARAAKTLQWVGDPSEILDESTWV